MFNVKPKNGQMRNNGIQGVEYRLNVVRINYVNLAPKYLDCYYIIIILRYISYHDSGNSQESMLLGK